MMKNKAVGAGVLLAGVLLAGVMPSCNKNKNMTGDSVVPVEYAGEQFRVPSMKNVVSDTVFEFDGVSVKSTRISRSAIAPQDSNYYISIDVYACDGNDVVNGALVRYIREAMESFQPDADSSDRSMGVDSVLVMNVAGLTRVADDAVGQFADVVIPQAKKDSVPGTSLAIDLRPVWANDSYITYSMAAQAYYGGAHGDSDFYLLTFDSKTGDAMGFYNLIPADRQEQVRKNLLDVISRTDGMTVEQYLAMVNQWIGNDKKENWTVATFPIYHVGLTGQGYVFCYPKYSIAPGSDGCPVYVVPIDK